MIEVFGAFSIALLFMLVIVTIAGIYEKLTLHKVQEEMDNEE